MEKSSAKGDFDSVDFEKRLTTLKDTQDGIQGMSAWCLQNRIHHKKIVNSWLTVLKQVKVEHRLTLFYLSNDVIQYSKRKNYEFVDSWGTALQKATTMVRDEKVKNKIERIFRIWEQRGIYNEEFLSDLHGLLSINPAKKPPPADNDDEQAAITVANIRSVVRLERETDRYFRLLSRAPLCDPETLNLLKDRRHVEEVEKQVNENKAKLEQYIQALSNEIKARTILIAVLDQTDAFYHNQRGEVKVVANAYKNFGNRIKTMKRKLDELTRTLPSPIPSPDINAPSPNPADDFMLPGEKSFDQSLFNKQSSLMGYMDRGALPFDINDFGAMSPKGSQAHQIQVINSCLIKDTESSVDDFFKSIMSDNYNREPQPVPPVPSSSATNSYPNYAGGYNPMNQYNQFNSNPASLPHSSSMFPTAQIQHSYSLSNLDICYNGPIPSYSTTDNPNTYNNPIAQPPLPPFEGNVSDEYNPDSWEMDMSWNTSQESGFNHSLDAPRSPPHYERKGVNTNIIEYIDPSITENHLTGSADVDHRQLLLPMSGANTLGKSVKDRGRLADVDHRNLISLTGSPKTEKDTQANASTTDNSEIDEADGVQWKKDMDFRQMEKSLISASQQNLDQKLEPPPSPPALLLAQSTGSEPSTLTCDINTNKLMNPPPQPPLFFQSSLSQKAKSMLKGQNKSPMKGQNGRDNTESIDMEMSDEDFDTIPEFQSPSERQKDLNSIESESHNSSIGSLPGLFATPPPSNYIEPNRTEDAWDQSKPNNNNNSFNNISDLPKLPNPFSTTPDEILNQLQQQQQQLMLQQQQHLNSRQTGPPRPLLDIQTNFTSPQHYLHHSGPSTPDSPHQMAPPPPPPHSSFDPRDPSQFMSHSPQMNFRGGGNQMRNNSPYFRGQKGRGNSNFRYRGNMRGKW